jgi:hypothetical protein
MRARLRSTNNEESPPRIQLIEAAHQRSILDFLSVTLGVAVLPALFAVLVMGSHLPLPVDEFGFVPVTSVIGALEAMDHVIELDCCCQILVKRGKKDFCDVPVCGIWLTTRE